MLITRRPFSQVATTRCGQMHFWTSLNMSTWGWSLYGKGGQSPVCDPSPKHTDRHDWKHYLPATSLAGGKGALSRFVKWRRSFNNVVSLHQVSRQIKAVTHLSDANELWDDVGALLRGGLAEDHALDPLGEPVEERDGPLQPRVVLQRGVLCIVLKVCELKHNKETWRDFRVLKIA